MTIILNSKTDEPIYNTTELDVNYLGDKRQVVSVSDQSLKNFFKILKNLNIDQILRKFRIFFKLLQTLKTFFELCFRLRRKSCLCFHIGQGTNRTVPKTLT